MKLISNQKYRIMLNTIRFFRNKSFTENLQKKVLKSENKLLNFGLEVLIQAINTMKEDIEETTRQEMIKNFEKQGLK